MTYGVTPAPLGLTGRMTSCVHRSYHASSRVCTVASCEAQERESNGGVASGCARERASAVDQHGDANDSVAGMRLLARRW